MRKTELTFTKSIIPNGVTLMDALAVTELSRHAQDWVIDCGFRQHSPHTIEIRQIVIKKLLWFLQRREYQVCGLVALRQFFDYVSHGHQEEVDAGATPN